LLIAVKAFAREAVMDMRNTNKRGVNIVNRKRQ
jgi:hypothetical protein